MQKILIKNYIPEYINQVIKIQEEYRKKYPEYFIRGEEVYTHYPIFENGNNIFCAFDTQNNLLAYAPIAPAPVLDNASLELPHQIWVDMIYDPSFVNVDYVKDILLEKIFERAKEIKEMLPRRLTKLLIVKSKKDIDEINYFSLKGFKHEQSAYVMVRDLSLPIKDVILTNEITIKRWKIDSLEEKQNYLKVDNICFPNHPMTPEKLEWNLNTLWSNGIAIGAFNQHGHLVGNVMAYFTINGMGVTEEVFVLPEWRGMGVAQSILREALLYLKEFSKKEAMLEVTASNESALNVYKKMDYQIKIEECFLGVNMN